MLMKTVEEKREGGRAKQRAVRASLYTYRATNSTIYQILINSSLGEEYRRLATKNEKREFLAKTLYRICTITVGRGGHTTF